MSTENKGQQQGSTEGEKPEDPGTLRQRFEEQSKEKDGTIRSLQVENAVIRQIPDLDTTKPNVKAFIAGFEGEPTTEAIQKAATEWGLITEAPSTSTEGEGETGKPAPKTPDPPSATEKEAGAAAKAAATGAAKPEAGEKADPNEVGLSRFKEAVEAGATEREAAAGFLDTIIEAAANGDERVIIPNGRLGPSVAANNS